MHSMRVRGKFGFLDVDGTLWKSTNNVKEIPEDLPEFAFGVLIHDELMLGFNSSRTPDGIRSAKEKLGDESNRPPRHLLEAFPLSVLVQQNPDGGYTRLPVNYSALTPSPNYRWNGDSRLFLPDNVKQGVLAVIENGASAALLGKDTTTYLKRYELVPEELGRLFEMIRELSGKGILSYLYFAQSNPNNPDVAIFPLKNPQQVFDTQRQNAFTISEHLHSNIELSMHALFELITQAQPARIEINIEPEEGTTHSSDQIKSRWLNQYGLTVTANTEIVSGAHGVKVHKATMAQEIAQRLDLDWALMAGDTRIDQEAIEYVDQQGGATVYVLNGREPEFPLPINTVRAQSAQLIVPALVQALENRSLISPNTAATLEYLKRNAPKQDKNNFRRY